MFFVVANLFVYILTVLSIFSSVVTGGEFSIESQKKHQQIPKFKEKLDYLTKIGELYDESQRCGTKQTVFIITLFYF